MTVKELIEQLSKCDQDALVITRKNYKTADFSLNTTAHPGIWTDDPKWGLTFISDTSWRYSLPQTNRNNVRKAVFITAG